MAQAYRDSDGLIRGSLEYGGGGVTKIVDGILPVLYPCTACRAITYHVLGSEPAGLCFQVPLVGIPLGSTHTRYGLLCNDCTTTSGISALNLRSILESRVAPAQVCDGLDRLLSMNSRAPLAYSSGFAKYMCAISPGLADTASWIAAYRRFDGR